MAKFMLLYTSPISAEEMMANATPEQRQAGMAPWLAWFGKHGSAVLDGGAPLGKGQRVEKTGANTASTSQVAGYSFIEAADLAAARAMLAEHPHYAMPGSSIEVFECLPM